MKQAKIFDRAFLGQVPLCFLAFVVVGFVLKLPKPDSSPRSSHWKKKIKRVDFLGAFVLVGAVFTLLLGLDRGSNESWGASVTIASLCVSVVAFVLFVFVELKIAVEPFASGRVVFGKSLFACYLCNFFSLGCYLAVLFYLPLFFQARGKQNLEATSHLLVLRLADGSRWPHCRSSGHQAAARCRSRCTWIFIWRLHD